MNTKISEAASSEESLRAFNSTLPTSLRVPYTMFYRIAMDAALDASRLHPQPAELAEQQGVDAHTLWAMAQLATGEGIEDGVRRIEKALAATGKQQVGEVQGDALRAALAVAVRQNSHDMLMTGEEIRQCEAALAARMPVQGIDLGQFREAVEAQHAALMDSWCGDPETKDAADQQRDRLLALIDQRDAAPGVGNG